MKNNRYSRKYKKMDVIYIAGPYRAKSEWQLEGFIQHAEKVAIKLWQEGWAVICPHKNTAHFGGTCDDDVWLKGYIEILKRCDAIYMLRDWRQSSGATAELAVAIENDLEVIYEE